MMVNLHLILKTSARECVGTKTKKEKLHMSQVAELGCICCNKLGFPGSPAQLHHIKNQTGVGRKSSHYEVIPLCNFHHVGSEEAYHFSPKTFTEKFGSQEDLLKETLELLKQKYG